MDVLKAAYDFADMAHKNEVRKFTGEPYIIHLQETAQLLWDVTDGVATADEYVAALLHDTVENTSVTLKEIGRFFGEKPMLLVEELTSNKEQQVSIGKAIYLSDKMNKMSEEAFTIKLCDRLSNVFGLDDNRVPSYFAYKYIEETQYILMNIDRSINEGQEILISRITNKLFLLKLKKNL
jgi:(p)ppGpp synthase/HD superfamily hydrolase